MILIGFGLAMKRLWELALAGQVHFFKLRNLFMN